MMTMYAEYFGLNESPFGTAADARFYYRNPSYREAYANLLFSVRERRGFVVLTGEPGTGKTTLLLRLMEGLGSVARFALVRNPKLGFEGILTFIGREFGLGASGGARFEKIQALNDFLIEQSRKGIVIALLIDEAQHLDDDALENLRLLSNLETHGERTLQIVFVGQQELLQKLDKAKFRSIHQRISAWIQLHRLGQEEVGAFIQQRLQSCGYRGRGLFTRDAIREVAFWTRGIPRLVNLVCDHALVIAYGTSKKKVSADIVREAATDLRMKGKLAIGGAWGPPSNTLADGGTGQERELGFPERNYSLAGSGRVSRIAAATVLGLLLIGGIGLAIEPLDIRSRFPGGDLTRETSLALLQRQLRSFDRHLEEFLDSLRNQLESFDRRFLNWNVGSEEERSDDPGKRGSLQPDSMSRRSTIVERQRPPLVEKTASGNPAQEGGPGEKNNEQQDIADHRTALAIPQEQAGSAGRASGRWRGEPVVVERSTSVREVVAGIHGRKNLLAVDLASQYNRHIENLDRLKPGQKVWIPPLNLDTLLRRRSDGTYSLDVASFRNSLAATRFSRVLDRMGYVADISQRELSDGYVVHRVTIVGLSSRRAVNRVWDLARANGWVPGESQPQRSFAELTGNRK